ncbi:Cna B-type domain-containing protein [Pseudoflavonifractor capillosus]|uniref:Cna B-type domain-containing protein n=1 Tax=Pseudoflavonifractor capillosus TaxID=106588 RepID=UPI00195F0C39|nr:Cna B-type domain-containing protein [Pseudoflavonifractor capillosus]MBM6694468.1 Cna B-type domain-containing protein [Pseudoflavonifractor capillosus]
MKKRWERLIAAAMSVVMAQTVCPPQAMALAASEVKEAAEYLEVDQLFSTTQSAVTTDSPENVETQTSAALFQDGAVRIYHALQLYAIGSNAVVHSGDAQAETFGTGTVLTDENGQVLLYDSDGSYQLMNDIALPDGTMWTLPSGFSGTFVSEGESTEAPLYDEDTDTIYIYNNYQLLTRAAEDELKTVLSGDNVAETFGLGQVVYAGDQQLEYTQDHNYVVAQSFTAQMPELKAEEILSETTQDATPGLDGRDYLGQVVYNDSVTGLQYILIGNKQQLQAIGKTDENGDPIKVTEPVWAQKQESTLGVIWEDVTGEEPVLYYSGDADLKSDGDYTELFSYDQEVGGHGEKETISDGWIPIGYTRNRYVGSDLVGTEEVTYNKNANTYHVNIERKDGDDFEPVYSTIANYIIFREIDLKNEPWTPLMFSGTMEGRLHMVSGTDAVIRNINVNQTGEMDASVNIGVGFFGTITNQKSTSDIGLSAGTTKVSNLTLDKITVTNTSVQMKETTTVISALTGLLGGLLGALGDLIGGIIGGIIPGDDVLGDFDLGETLGKLLNAREAAPDNFATGAFAGRVIGDVLVENCHVTNASVSNVMNMTGGFVGNVEGLTEYDGLSKLLGGTVDTLEAILNVIPGLGLGDLVEVLLDNPNLISVKKLIPTGYKKATIQNCSVTLDDEASSVGKNDTKFNGGFVGCQTGSAIKCCQVSGVTAVSAQKYAGGFAGATRDAVIKGILSEAGLDLLEDVIPKIKNVDPSAKTESCTVDANGLKINATAYGGGFTGIVANSDISNSSVSDLSAVSTTGNYAGGFAGRATLGSSVLLVGEGDIADKGLLGEVTGLLGSILEGNDADTLLSVIGVFPSRLNGCTVDGIAWNVSAGEYAGGFIGSGEGVQVSVGGNGRINSVANINSVTSEGDYAGGLTGQLVPANSAGVLNNTLGIAAVKECSVSHVSISGPNEGFTVSAKGKHAGGAIGVTVGGDISNVSVNNLKQVSAVETAGGFMGSNSAVGLLNSDGLNLLGWNLIKIDGLLKAVPYFVTDCTNCYVSYAVGNDAVEPQVTANSAGGFIGEMYSGSLNNSTLNIPYVVDQGDSDARVGKPTDAVRYITSVKGISYAGGFAGKIVSGSLVDAAGGIGVAGIKVNLSEVLSVLEVYIPEVTSAGVFSASGLRVEATQTSGTDADAGSAGGYAGLIRGARITESSVSGLATKADVENREDNAPIDGDWAVIAPKTAGGYAGQIDIGYVAKAGSGVEITGVLQLAGLLNAISVVESRLNLCDVAGMPGGFNVKSTNGSAGGYAGEINGSWLNGCDTDNYEYIEAVDSAGGFVGTIQPGDVANIVQSTSLLEGLVEASNFLSVAQTLIPRLYNCSTAAVPCGGYVRATGKSDAMKLRGMAGGYVGYNVGGRIWGNVQTDPADKSSTPTNLADSKLAETKRVREVYGLEYAGGFTGRMVAANIADTGGLRLLYGLIETSNLISALQAVYPTETNTQTTGPLRGLDEKTWDAWVKAVGSSGAYGDELASASFADLETYIYGYTVKAGVEDDGTGILDGGAAGGYVGRMEAGVITGACAQDVRLVTAHRNAGGFAGEMITGTVLKAGEIKLAGLNIVDGLGVIQSFVPVIYTSKTVGYKSGMEIKADGVSNNEKIGNAGGFVGASYGGQIWDTPPSNESVETTSLWTGKAGVVSNLKDVLGTRCAGGFAGVLDTASAAEVDVQSKSGLLSQILTYLMGGKTIDSLASVLKATLPTVQSATVNAPESTDSPLVMEYVVREGTRAAGGFVGMANGAILGRRENTGNGETKNVDISIHGVRAVIGGEHVGGFAGLADNGGVVEVAENPTSILELLGLTNVDVLNHIRTYFYNCKVEGSGNGLSVYATEAATGAGSTTDETESNQVYQSGNAGGFVGSLLNASALDCQVENLKMVRGRNYVGGFAGLSGKSGTVDVDHLEVFGKILSAAAGVLDIFGSHVDDSTVKGMSGGYTISATGGEDSIAGGFIGYGDLSRVNYCDAVDLKQVYSDQQAGGFVGRTNFAYLADLNVASPALLNPILTVVNKLLELLYVNDLENLDLIDIELPGILENVLKLEVLKDGNALSVTLLGLKISVALSKGTGEGGTDVAEIWIGDSYIKLPCSQEDGIGTDTDNIKIGLIKANRTKVANCTVAGVTNGYDVFGGGANNDTDGSSKFGYTGGFVGCNKEGLLEYNTMDKADTIRGTEKLVGAFSGKTMLKSVYDFNTLKSIEGMQNRYTVYRLNEYGDELDRILYRGQIEKPLSAEYQQIEIGAVKYHSYTVIHRGPSNIEQGKYASYFQAVWEDAMLNSSEHPNALAPANVYVSSAQAQLMLGVATEQNRDTTVPQGGAMQDPCSGDIHLTIEKIWYDNENKGGTRPSEITVTLYQDEDIYPIKGQDTFTMNAQLAGMDANIWTYEVDVPADGASHTYSVSEEPVDGYVTFYYSTSDDPYTLYILNFLITELMVDDTVVIDYGLPVAVDVLDNDALGPYQIAGELAGVATFDENDLYKTFADTSRTFEKLDLSYGTAVTNIDVGVLGTELYDKLSNVKGETTETDGGSKRDVYYVPDTMQMDSLEKMLYVVKLDSEHVKNDQNYITGALSIIPATEIFYEDNFGAIEYSDGKKNDGSLIVWDKPHGSGFKSDYQQDTDRPGSTELGKLWDDLYGNDTHYKDDSTYSNGTAKYVEIGEDTKTFPSAEFTFKGTGFDVISVTSGETGTIKVNVYDVNQENKKVKGYIIDTYYGYNFVDGEWVVDESADASNALYQVPVLKVEDLPWGTYKAEIIPTYHKAYDDQYQEGEDNSYRFYLDAIRIYDPAKPDGEHYKEIEEVYEKDGENRPGFMEIRDILLNANNTSEGTEIGAVFVDGNGALTDIEDYEAYGPKNEVYLAPGQAISFNLETTSKDIPDKLQLSAKLESGSSTQMTIELAVPAQDRQWVPFRAKTHPIKTAYDLYYEFGEQCVWEAQKNEAGEVVSYKTKFPIVIRNSSSSTTEGADVVPTDDPNANLDDKVGNLLSLTNLKWTGSAENKQEGDEPTTVQSEENRTAQQDLLVTSSWENVEAAYYLLNPVQQYTVTVKYQDENGNSLAEDQVLQVYDGAEYDATKLLEQAIKGYQFQRVQGEATGVATGDVEIVVIYQKLRMETLQQLIDRAKTMVDCAHKYVQTQWEALLDALAAAEQLLSVEHVTQEQVDDTASALLEAIMAQRFQANKENLEAILEQAKDMDLSGYTVESAARFQAALDAAQAVMDDDSLSEEEQQTVDAATEALAAAMEGLTAETEPEEPEATDAPQATDAPEVSQQPEATNAPQTTDEPQATPESEAQVPQTGDESGLTIWLTTLFVCAAAGIGMGMKIKTRKEEEQ